jgi:hypothetical protein
MTDLTLTFTGEEYDAATASFEADLATIEQHSHGAARQAALRIHARLLYWQGRIDEQNGIVRPFDGGTPKPPPAP